MMKKILIIAIVTILFIVAGMIYLNNVILPVKIKSLVVKTLEDQTQKKVSLESLQFSIFKGLVLRNLVIYDNDKKIITLKEGSCTFLIPPVFKKIIAIPNIRIRSAEVWLARRKDNTFNLHDFFALKPSGAKPPQFNIFIYKITATEGVIHFRDESIVQAFVKDLEHINLSLGLSLPAKVKFNLSATSMGKYSLPIKIHARGEYAIPQQELTAKISLEDIELREFSPYYQDYGIAVDKGLIDILADIRFKENVLSADISAKNKGLELSKDKNMVSFDSSINSHIEYSLKDKQMTQFKGNAKITAGALKLANASLENITGSLEFDRDQLKWSDFDFKYLDVPYESAGNLSNFQSPKVQLRLASKDLSLDSDLAFDNKLIKLTRAHGKYLNSDFSLEGNIDTNSLIVDINGELNFDLKDAKELPAKSKNQLENAKLEGIVNAKMSLKGNINDIKSCNIQAKFSSPEISAYGLKAKEFSIVYNQSDGMADIPQINLTLYDGTVEGKANMNLNSANLPFWIEANILGVKLEKLKLDTPAKDKDLGGTLQASVKLNGFSNDISKLSGSGNISIADGKLWQLNLFQGLGALLFTKDFTNIVFSEGACGFIVEDSHIFTDTLKLKSNITDLSGTVKIGFDNSIDASISVEVINEMVPLSGTFKDITTAIAGKGGLFGVIKISGTLQKPKYKFKPAVSNIIKGITDILFGNPR